MRIGTTIEARMASSRFPGKVLKKILVGSEEKPLIQVMIERIKKSVLLDEIIVATTVNPKDDELCAFLDQINVKYYRGSEDNVLDRVLRAARANNIDILVELTGDCPLIDPVIIDQSIGLFLKNGDVDYIANTTISADYPRGTDVQVYSVNTLADVSTRTTDMDDLENVSLFIYRNQQFYTCLAFPASSFYVDPDTRLTVDYPVDLAVIETLVKELGQNCSLEQICDFFDINPKLRELNAKVGTNYVNDDTRFGKKL